MSSGLAVTNARVKIAIIGSGRHAREHAKALQLLAHVEIVGVCSRSRESRDRFAADFDIGADFATSEVSSLFSMTQADAVVVAVSAESISDVAPKILDDPWVILFEKPLGIDLDEAEYLAQLASSRSQGTFVALNRRHYGNIKSVLAEVDLNEGKRLVQVSDQQWTCDALSRVGGRNLSENWMFVNSIHVVDLVRFFCRGSIERIRTTGWLPGMEPRIVSSVIDFTSGDRATYQSIWNAPGPWSVAVTTESGRWEMAPLEQTTFNVTGTAEKVVWLIPEDDLSVKAGLLVQAKNLVKAVRGDVHDLVTIQDSLVTMRLIHSLYFPTSREKWIADA